VAARERCVGVPVSKRSRPVRETGRRTAVPGDGAYALSYRSSHLLAGQAGGDSLDTKSFP
jgi:hypothetical protein